MIRNLRRVAAIMIATLVMSGAATVVTSTPASASRGPNYVTAYAHGAPTAVQFSGLVMIAPPPGHDYWKRNCVTGESGSVCGNWSVNETPDGPYWTLAKTEEWNMPGGDSSVRFRTISHSGYVLPSRTMLNNQTHCWFPDPVYDAYPVAPCGAFGEKHPTAFDGANFSTTLRTTVDGSNTSASCYVVTPFAKTVVSGACVGAP